MKAMLCFLLLLVVASTVKTQELKPAGHKTTLRQLETYIRQFSTYGAQVDKSSLAPEFENLGTAVAVMMQQMYLTRMGGKALVAEGGGSRRLRDYTAPPDCSALGCSCANGALTCYGLYNLFWLFQCPCAQTPSSTSPCRYDILAGDAVSWTDPSNPPMTYQRAPRCPVRVSQTPQLYDCKGTGCRAKYKDNTDQCPHPCSDPTAKIICLASGQNPTTFSPPSFTHKILTALPTATSQDPNHIEQCNPNSSDCQKNVYCGAPAPCTAGSTTAAAITCETTPPGTGPTTLNIPNTVCKYNPSWTGKATGNGDPAITCPSNPSWSTITSVCPP